MLQDSYDVRIIKLVKPGKKDIILDDGAGNGRFSIALARRGASVVALDINKSILEVALKAVKKSGLKFKIDVVVGDIQNLPFKDDSFSKILCVHNLWYVTRYATAVKEMFRTLKSEGTLVIDHLNLNNPCFIFSGFISRFIGLRTLIWRILHKPALQHIPTYHRTPKQILQPFKGQQTQVVYLKKWGVCARLLIHSYFSPKSLSNPKTSM